MWGVCCWCAAAAFVLCVAHNVIISGRVCCWRERTLAPVCASHTYMAFFGHKSGNLVLAAVLAAGQSLFFIYFTPCGLISRSPRCIQGGEINYCSVKRASGATWRLVTPPPPKTNDPPDAILYFSPFLLAAPDLSNFSFAVRAAATAFARAERKICPLVGAEFMFSTKLSGRSQICSLTCRDDG